MSMLGYKRLTENAFKPVKGSPLAAGFDLKSAYELTIQKRDRILVKTDLSISLPEGCYGRIAPRSGLALKFGIDVGAGVIDKDYTGNICVLLFNHTDEPFKIQKGDRIAQLICECCKSPELYEVKTLACTNRGDKGFGSSGNN